MKELISSNQYVALAVAFAIGFIVRGLICRLFCKSCKNGQQNQKKFVRKDDKPFEKRKPHPAPADGSVEIYVGNLSYDMTEQELRDTFAQYGTVSMCRLVINKFNGRSKGFGFIQMPVRAEAEKACAELNDKEIQGRRIKCNEAKNLI